MIGMKYKVIQIPTRLKGRVDIGDQIRVIDVYEAGTVLEIRVLSGQSSGDIFFIPRKELKNRLEKVE